MTRGRAVLADTRLCAPCAVAGHTRIETVGDGASDVLDAGQAGARLFGRSEAMTVTIAVGMVSALALASVFLIPAAWVLRQRRSLNRLAISS